MFFNAHNSLRFKRLILFIIIVGCAAQFTAVRAIRLVISQYPAGETVHQIWGGADANKLTLLYEFKGFTDEPKTLEFEPSPPLTGIRYIRIVTTRSPSWVWWREIEVIGSP